MGQSSTAAVIGEHNVQLLFLTPSMPIASDLVGVVKVRTVEILSVQVLGDGITTEFHSKISLHVYIRPVQVLVLYV